MRTIALALALCISFAPLEAATTHLVKARKNKVKGGGHKVPKRKNKQHSRVN